MQRNGIIACAAAAMLMLAGCSSGGTQDGPSSQAPSSSQAAPVAQDLDLTWAMWVAGTADQEAWQKVGDAVTDVHPNLTVTLQGSDFANYFVKLHTSLSTADGPCLAGMQSLRMADFTDEFLPLQDLIDEHSLDLSEFDQVALDGMRVDGELYGLPYDTGPILMFYNVDMLEANGLELPENGWTVEEFEAMGETLLANGEKLFAPGQGMYLQSLMLAYNGGRIITTDAELDLDNPGFAEGLDWVGSLYQRGMAIEPADAGATRADADHFATGRAASYVAGPWTLLPLLDTLDFTVGAVTIPTSSGTPDTFAAGSGFGISKNCPHPEEAFEALAAMTSETVLGNLATDGRAFPARTAVQNNWLEQATEVVNIDSALQAARESAQPLRSNPNADNLDAMLARYTPDAMTGKTTGAAAMQEIAQMTG